MLDFSPENREKSELPYDEFQQELERMKKKILAKTGRQEQDKVVEDILELHRDDWQDLLDQLQTQRGREPVYGGGPGCDGRRAGEAEDRV